MSLRNRFRRLRRNERGSLSVWMLLVVVVIVGVVGFVVDSSGKFQADAAGQQVANNAARAAANSISGNGVYTGALDINAGQAESTGRQYLAAAGVDGTVTVSGQVVTVTVTSHYPTKFLSIIGISTLPVHGKASAELLTQQ